MAIIFSFVLYASYGQVNNIKWVPNPLADTTKAKVCVVRGHVSSEIGVTTLVYCPPYIIDSDSTTVKVYPSCNTTKTYCERCNSAIIVGGSKEVREVIWKKIKKK